MVDANVLRIALGRTLDATHFSTLGQRYEGKVRDNYTTEDGRRFVVVTDRISAFDRVLGTIPLKGQVLNQLAAFWFDRTRHVAPNHVVSVPDPNVIEARECVPLKVEMVMRSYATGVTSTSLWHHYEKGVRVFCGNKLPDGLRKNEKLPEPILTPSTKAPLGAHDISVSRQELLAAGEVTAAEFDEAAEYARNLFAFGQRFCDERGLILVDTKYEFGKDAAGNIVVIDEIHTPDSSRYWFKGTYADRFAQNQEPESFDKEFIRRYLNGLGFRGDGPIPPLPDDVRIEAANRYIETYEAITGVAFEPNVDEPIARIRKNLGC